MYRLGWIPDVPDQRDFKYTITKPIPLPPLLDLRPKCPPIYDQGNLGSCTAQAIGGAIEFDRDKQGLGDWVPSRLQIYYNERVMEGTVSVDAGAMIRDGVKSAFKQGAAEEVLWPYDITKFANAPTPGAVANALLHKVQAYLRVELNLATMKHCLVQHGPFVIGIAVFDSFFNAPGGDVPMPGVNENMAGGHAILIVGYDDSTQAFRFRNSWGAGWGNQGYGTIPYAYLTDNNLSDDAWAITVTK